MKRIWIWIKYRPNPSWLYIDTPAHRVWLLIWRWAVNRLDRWHEQRQ
jgi:hypothetical protein